MRMKKAFVNASRLRLLFAVLLSLAAMVALVGVVSAGPRPGVILRSFVPAHVGDGRAVAFDPVKGQLYYTNAGDSNIYVVDTNGNPITTLTPKLKGLPIGFSYSALTWQGQGLLGARNDGTGQFDAIVPPTGPVTPIFKFSFPSNDSCYTGQVDHPNGLAFDSVSRTLWISDRGARHIYNVTITGAMIRSAAVYRNRCNTGIAAGTRRLWLGILGGPSTAPFEILNVGKPKPASEIFDQILFSNSNAVPEGLAFDTVTFAPQCAVWTNQAGSTMLTAWQVKCEPPKK